MKKCLLAVALASSISFPTLAEQFNFSTNTASDADTLVLFKYKNSENDAFANYPFAKQLNTAMADNAFTGEYNAKIELAAPQNTIYKRVFVVGLGEKDQLAKATKKEMIANTVKKIC